jgi:MFS family permease
MEAISQNEIEATKKYSLKEAITTNLTMGFGENYISPYLIALGGGSKEVSLLSAIPNLFAPLFQLTSWRLMNKYSRKKIIVNLLLWQSLMYFPIISLIFLYFKNISYVPILLIFFYTLYVIFGNIAAPVWASWIGDIIEKNEIAKFFGKRNSLASIFYLLGMFFASLILELCKKKIKNIGLFIGFGIIFLLAAIFKLFSRYFFLKHHEKDFKPSKESYFSFFDFIREAPRRNYGRFSLYVALIVLATNIAGPYFALYMLKDLSFSYFQFMLVNAITALMTFLSMPFWGRFSNQYGNIYTLRIGSFLIPIIALLWPVTLALNQKSIFLFVLLLNAFSGFAWAAFNLAAGNFVFDAATQEKRSLCAAYSNILNGIGVFIGATLGNFIIMKMVKISNANPIMILSVFSGTLRFLIAVFLVFKIKEVKVIEQEPNLSMTYIISQVLTYPVVFLENIFIKRRKNKNL